jgi:GH15 family glucan-1,4-alpha-glucosidase
MERLLGVTTDLGLLAEEYDPVAGRLAGNFPQAFSHLGLVRAADALDGALGTPHAAPRAGETGSGASGS